MAFRKKFYLSLFFLLSFFIYSILVNYQVASHQLRGRIIKVDKKYGFDMWKLILFSNGDILEIDIESKEDVERLLIYDEKYVLITYGEYLMRGPVALKYRLESWEKVISTKKIEGIENRILEKIDNNLTCSFLSQLRSDKRLEAEVIDYLKGKKFNIEQAFSKCEN